MPLDIKHVEKIVQYAGANKKTLTGSQLCSKDECIDAQKIAKMNLMGTQKYFSGIDENFSDNANTLMKQLQAHYKKNVDYTFNFVQKSVVESNLFSQKRATFEGIVRTKQNEQGKRLGSTSSMPLLQSTSTIKKPTTATKQEGDEVHATPPPEEGAEPEESLHEKTKDGLGGPAGRKEVELLNQWLDEMMEKHVYSYHGMERDSEVR